MATLLELYDARRQDGPLPKRIESAILKAAYDIRNEDPQVVGHAGRLAWANAVRTDQSERAMSVEQGLILCLENPTIGANPSAATDNDIQFMINSSVYDLAGMGI